MRQHQMPVEKADAIGRPFRSHVYGEASFAGSSPEGTYPINVLKATDEDEQSWQGFLELSRIQGAHQWLGEIPTVNFDVWKSFLLPLNLQSSSTSLAPEHQRQCEQAVQDLLITAGEPNWDREGADPVTTEIVEIARRVIKELPGDIEIPQISADPQGNVEFDWYLENGTMFTISIGKEGDVAISGLHQEREDRLTALEKDTEDPLPLLLSYGVQWLRKMKDR